MSFRLSKLGAHALAVSMLLVSCGRPEQASQAATSSSDWLALSEVGAYSTPMAYSGRGDVDQLADGSVVLLDSPGRMLLIVHPATAAVETVATGGSGPGELGIASEMEVLSDGRIAVLDVSNRRLSFWSPSGTYLRALRLPFDGFPFGLWAVGGELVVRVHSGNLLEVVRLDASSGSALGTLVRLDTESATSSFTCLHCAIAVGPLGLVVAGAPDTLYQFSQLSSVGEALRTWRRTGLPAAELSVSQREELRRALTRGAAISGTAIVDVPRFRARLRAGTVAIDESAHVWVLSSEDSAGTLVDLFSTDSGFVGSVKIAHRISRIVWRGNRLVALGEGADGEPRVFLFTRRQ